MMKNIQNIFYLLFVLIVFHSKKIQAQNINIHKDSNYIKTQSVLSQMSLKQKVFELHGRGIIKLGLSLFFTNKISPVSFGGNKKLGIPKGLFVDGPRGVGIYKGVTAFPVTMARSATWDRDLERRVGVAMSEEIRAIGANYSGSVCVNLLRHPANGRAQECYGEDSYLTGEMGLALMLGIQSNQVQACVKHFALNSMENNRFGGNIKIDERTLYEVYLPHFKKIIDGGVASVMSAYNKVNGEYCGENEILLNDILRKNWSFTGYVTSDWQYGIFNANKGLNAQMNIEMPSHKVYNYFTIKKMISENRLSISKLDSIVFPILYTKFKFQSAKDLNTKIFPKSYIGSATHVNLAREVAEKSMVLLKNEQAILPLNKNQCNQIAIIGSLANIEQTGDRGSSNVNVNEIISINEALKNYCIPTCKIQTAENKDRNKIIELCTTADLVIVMAGYSYKDEGEFLLMGKIRDSIHPNKQNVATRLGIVALGGDRAYIHLHQEDIEIIQLANKLNKKVIVCLAGGAAITVEEWEKETPVIIETFYCGMEGGNALVNLLFGEINPSGKLPFTVPVNASDLPMFNSFSTEVTYDYYHGYSLFDKTHKPVRYPFGYGLSYTTFDISSIHLNENSLTISDTLQLSVQLKNTGNRKGAEVVQCYIGYSNSKIDRPLKILKGFEKKELLPLEQTTVYFSIPVKDLAWYNPQSHLWEIEKMTYEVLVGNQSRDNHFQKAIFVVN